jgi:hypothetical protein
MPHRQRRPDRSPSAAAAVSDDTTSVESATTGGVAYRWSECPRHEWLGVSVINDLWCVGDGYELPGHPTQVAA